ncbi:oligosaccharide flippase family protein [Erythrobacter vulgaris]|uniref:Oligosaccharide flippase family protein n=1 Tax=Qipengyuania vulgaris TaxID=291985 RepID=A0A844XQ88_9SPHN|nr:oligosaccharide flippase family protein [Qipengyuania vulgaris]
MVDWRLRKVFRLSNFRARISITQKISLAGLAENSVVIRALSLRATAVLLKAAQVIILVRLFGESEFGIYSIALSVFLLTMLVGRLGLDHYILKEAASSDEDTRARLTRLSYFSSIPAVIAAAAGYAFVTAFYSQNVATSFLVLGLSAPLYATMWNSIFLLRGLGRVNISIFLFEVIGPLSLLAIAFLARDLPYALAAAFFLSTLVVAVGARLALGRVPAVEKDTARRGESPLRSVAQAKSFYAFSLIEGVQSLLDSLVIGFFLRPVDVTFYAIIMRITTLILLPVTITTIYANNIAARFSRNDLASGWHALRKFTHLNLAFSLFAFLGAILLLPLVNMIFDVEFTNEASMAYVAVAMARFFQGATATVRSALFMGGHERGLSLLSVMVLVPYSCALVAFTPTYGISFVGFSVLGFALAFGIFSFWYLRKKII